MGKKQAVKPKIGRPIKQEGDKDTKEKILEVSIGLFANNGFEKTTIRQIAAAIGLTEGAVYRHFSGKEELLDCIFDHAEQLLFTPLPVEQTLGALQGHSIFRGLLESLPDIIASETNLRNITRIMFNEMNQHKKIAQYYVDYKKATTGYTRTLFEKCVDAGTLLPCDVNTLSAVFNSFRSEWAYHTFIINQPESFDLDKIKSELNEVIVFFEQLFINSPGK
jgi:AcrR family transcriptional regulator